MPGRTRGLCRTFLPPDASSAFALGVDTAGDVEGGYNDIQANLVHGFRRDTDNNFTTIDFPGANLDLRCCKREFSPRSYAPGQFNTQLGQINKNGWFVGSYENKHGKAFASYAKPSPGGSVLVDADDEQ